jgi:hypothetical protein
MKLTPEQRRRWMGAVILAVALLMLIAGETLLKGKLSPVWMLAYWLACFALAAISMIYAVLDASAVARQTAKARRELAAHTVQEIEQSLRDKRQNPKP